MDAFETMRLFAAEARHAVAEVRRIGSLASILREIPAATTMFVDSFSVQSLAEKAQCTDGQPVIFMTGFFAKFDYYLRLAVFLHTHNTRLIIPHELGRNTLSWKQSHIVLSDTIKEVEDETGVVPGLIGHSKGGTDIAGILGEHPEIKKAILVSAPLRGSSLRALNLFLSWVHSDLGYPIDEDVLTDPEILSKLTVIVSDHDNVVPPHEAMIEGAGKTIKVQTNTGWLDPWWHSHTGLPYYAREAILKSLQEQSAAIH